MISRDKSGKIDQIVSSRPILSSIELFFFKFSVSFFIFSRHTAASVSSLIVNMFQGTSISKNRLREQRVISHTLLCSLSSLRFLPVFLELQFFLKLGLLILHPAGQDQIIVRDVPLAKHGHVFLLPVDRYQKVYALFLALSPLSSTC